MKKHTNRLTAALCATVMTMSMAAAVELPNATVSTEVQGDVMLIDDTASAPVADAALATQATMQYSTIAAIEGNKLTLEITATAQPFTMEVLLTEATAIVDCATGMAYDPATLTVGEGIYSYTAVGATGITAVVANLPMDMQAPTLITVADCTEDGLGNAIITDLAGERYTLSLGTTILNRYVAWNMPATLDLPLPSEITAGRNVLLYQDAVDPAQVLYRVVLLPAVNLVDSAIDLHETVEQVPAQTTTVSMILVNGEPIEATTLEHNGNTLFPLRAVAEPFGITVSWDTAAFCPWVTVAGKNETLPFGEDTVLVNDTTYVSYDVVVNTLGLEARLQQGAFALTLAETV